MSKGLLAHWRRGLLGRGITGALLLAVPVATAAVIGFSGGFGSLTGGLSELTTGPEANLAVAPAADDLAPAILAVAGGPGGAPPSGGGPGDGGPGDGGGGAGPAPGPGTAPGGGSTVPNVVPDVPPVTGGGGGGGGGVEDTVNGTVDGAVGGVNDTVGGVLGGH